MDAQCGGRGWRLSRASLGEEAEGGRVLGVEGAPPHSPDGWGDVRWEGDGSACPVPKHRRQQTSGWILHKVQRLLL